MNDFMTGVEHLPKLFNISEYYYWRQVVQNYLQGRGLWKYVNGKALEDIQQTCEDTEQYEALHSAWAMFDSQAKTVILLTVHRNIADASLVNCKTSKDMFQALDRRFGKFVAT